MNSAIAYVNSTSLLGADSAASLKQQVSDVLSSSLSLVPRADNTIKAGYEAIYT